MSGKSEYMQTLLPRVMDSTGSSGHLGCQVRASTCRPYCRG